MNRSQQRKEVIEKSMSKSPAVVATVRTLYWVVAVFLFSFVVGILKVKVCNDRRSISLDSLVFIPFGITTTVLWVYQYLKEKRKNDTSV